MVRGPSPSAPSYASSECVLVESEDPEAAADGGVVSACECRSPFRAPAVLAVDAGGGCLVYGRSLRCLYAADEFAGCDPTRLDACEARCAELERRQAADAATTFDAGVHGAVCDRGECGCVLEIEGECFEASVPVSFDCARSAQDILGVD